MKKILLLNPPGKDIYIRDYYCSKTTQADYLIPPVDLLMASARLSSEKYDIKVVDAIAENIQPYECLKICKDFAPQVVISLVGAVSWTEDVRFIKELRYSLGKDVFIIASGDILMDEAEKRFAECPEIDAAIFDFTNEDVVRLIDGEFQKVECAAFRDLSDGKLRIVKNPHKTINGEYSVGGIPRHEFFIDKKYRHPFAHGRKFATLLTEFGCPYKCSFCIIGTLQYKRRPIEEIIREIRYIKSLGVNELFVATQTFGASGSYALKLCEEIQKEKVRWFTFSRVDVVDEEMLYAMKNAGCHTIIFGVESGSEKILAHYRKGYDKKRIKDILEICRRIGIETVGTFILGLPEDDKDTLSETLSFIKELPLDYASFNVAVPRHGTDLRNEAISKNLIDPVALNIMDQSRAEVSVGTKSLTAEEVLAFRRKMVKAFYLSPRYLLRRIYRIRSVGDFFSHIKQAVSLIRRTWS